MSCTHSSNPTASFSLSFQFLSPNPKTTIPSNSTLILARNCSNPRLYLPLSKTQKRILKKNGDFVIRASVRDKNNNNGASNWVNWLPTEAFSADKVFRLISTATASPIYQFIASPSTFLHSVDARIKLVWLLALVLLPARSHILMRFGLVVFTALLSIWILPKQVWMDQLGRVSLLSGVLFIMLGLGSDGVPSLVQSRTPPSAITGLPNLPISLGGYSYLIMKLGPLQFTRKGLSVASTAACLTFTIFQSSSLCLATTTPEQLAFALRWFMLPLTYIGVPVAEIVLTLLLSLRFISLVFDEIEIGLSVFGTFFFASYIRRIFKNIFGHAEQISQAMIVRGFRGDSSTHKIYSFSNSSIGVADFVSLFCLVGVVGAALVSDRFLL
ncbi:protein ABCI12 [Citrus sinensis]|nr:protein ABCI12 [Citrus sinensis]